MDKLSLELFSIFCLYSSIHYLVQSCYLIKVLLHYSVIRQWYYKNWFRYFCMFSILYISHRTGWRYQCIRDVATNKPILTLKSYQTKTSTLNLTRNVETEISVLPIPSFYPHKVLFTSTHAWPLVNFLFRIEALALQFCVATRYPSTWSVAGKGSSSYSLIFTYNICVVAKQMRNKTTRKLNKWPITKATLRFSL